MYLKTAIFIKSMCVHCYIYTQTAESAFKLACGLRTLLHLCVHFYCFVFFNGALLDSSRKPTQK